MEIIENGICTVSTPELEEWRNSAGQLHRLDGPAKKSVKKYSCNVFSRISGKWEEDNEGVVTIEYYFNDELHRTDGPALSFAHRHIKDGITIIDRKTEWRIHGKLHNLDGPALINNYHYQYYINGVNLTKDCYDEYKKLMLEHNILLIEYNKLLEFKNMISITLETVKNSHEDTGEHDDYYNIPKALVETLLEKL